MIKKIINLVVILMSILLFNGCEKTGKEAGFSKPVIYKYVEKDTIMVGSDAITPGPLKDYESDSEVIYKLTVTSEKPLSKFIVTTTEASVSKLSRIVATEPAEAIDTLGNFTKSLNNVVIYYAYHIHPLTVAKSVVKVTFALLDNGNNAAYEYDVFSAIKTGSTNGKPLNAIYYLYEHAGSLAIGTQGYIMTPDIATWQEGGEFNTFGPFFSFKRMLCIKYDVEALDNIDDIDFIGYYTRYAGTNPVLTNSKGYLASPSDSVLLTTTYGGAVAAAMSLYGNSGTANITYAGLTLPVTYVTSTSQTATNFLTANAAAYTAKGLTLTRSNEKLIWTAINPSNIGFDSVKITTLTGNLTGENDVTRDIRKNLLMRKTIRAMWKKQLAAGKQMKVVYFDRLDNKPVGSTNLVTTKMFDLLTHDNEFDTFLAGIEAAGKIRTEPLENDRVYGFVSSDGKRGLIRTSTPKILVAGVTFVNVPNLTTAIYCTIKYQNQ